MKTTRLLLLVFLGQLAEVQVSHLVAGERSLPHSAKGRIFVAVQTAPGSALEDDYDPYRGCAILAVDPDTGASETLVEKAIDPCVAVDGRTVAYASREGVCVHFADRSGNVIVRSNSESQRRSFLCALSLNGRELIISVMRPISADNPRSFDSWRYLVAGGAPTKLAIPDSDGVLDWSPDGDRLLTLRSGRGGGALQLYSMRPDGTGQRCLSDGTGMISTARFSPDGKHIVYMHQMGNKNSLWTMDADSQNRHKIVDYGANWHPWACWSPDGKHLAVIDNEYDEGRHPANYHLDVMDANGGHRRTLVSKALWMSMPDWR